MLSPPLMRRGVNEQQLGPSKEITDPGYTMVPRQVAAEQDLVSTSPAPRALNGAQSKPSIEGCSPNSYRWCSWLSSPQHWHHPMGKHTVPSHTHLQEKLWG